MTQCLQELTDALKTLGPVALAYSLVENGKSTAHADLLANQLLMILREQHACQCAEIEDTDESDDEDEIAELDALLISSSADCVAAMATCLGAGFAQYFSHFFPLIKKYFKASRTLSDRSMAVGSLAEIAEGLEDGVTPFTNDLMSIFINGMSDEEDEVKSNSGFGAGVLCLNTKQDVTAYIPQLLTLLHPLFGPSKTNMRDNACGAVCRLISAMPNAMPLEHVLPVVLGSLPLEHDFEENTPVFNALILLLNKGSPLILSALPKIMDVFAAVLGSDDQISEHVRKDILEFLNGFKALHAADFEGVLASMAPENAAALLRSI